MLWSVAQRNAKHQTITRMMTQVLAYCHPKFVADEIANTLWSMSHLSVVHVRVLSSLAITRFPFVWQCGTVELSNNAWALATRTDLDSPVLSSIAASSVCGCNSPADLSKIVWAYARIGLTDYPLFESLSAQSRPILSDF
eukprot:gnl/MRDRNA2_/MRDRNA2_82359_c0_seq1.p1 gnl/MRDRNA2_/MRDRNA2_82359_c0~~gnl/MRDRNA2_/MRDRNA2_82359_c0_seq1.p1  ORF type:complete len:140 (-),score=8.22 gnl/MRDRNA2_/MRDRNA2_82359_c0_seq1:15-434(-)